MPYDGAVSGLKVTTRNNTIRCFERYRLAFGEAFTRQLTSTYHSFQLKIHRSASEVSHFSRITTFLVFLSTNKSMSDFRNLLRIGVSASGDSASIYVLYSNAVAMYREHLSGLTKAARTKNNIVSSVRKFINHLADEGIFPQGIIIAGFKFEQSMGDSLLSATILCGDVLGGVDELWRQAGQTGLERDEETDCLMANIIAEFPDKDIVNSADSMITNATLVLDKRINQIRAETAKRLVAAHEKFEIADKWLNDKHHREVAISVHKYRKNWDQAQGKRNVNVEPDKLINGDVLPFVVNYLELYNEGVFPGCRREHTNDSHNTLFAYIHKNILKRNGFKTEAARPYISLDHELLAMAYSFIMLEILGNGQSIIDLELDCISPSPKGNKYLRVNWVKHRKKTNINEYEDILLRDPSASLTADNLTVIDVINLVIRGTRSYRIHVIDRDKNALFIGSDRSKKEVNKYYFIACKPALSTFLHHFKALCSHISGGTWVSTPKALRTSQLLLSAMLDKDVFAVQEKARHRSLKSSMRYVDHVAEKLRREQNIREFFDWMETLVTINIDCFAEKIGIDTDEYEKRKHTLLNQQFGGIHCQDPYAGFQPETTKGQVCDKIEKCAGCGNRRLFFLTSIENICNLIHWHDSLLLVQSKMNTEEFEDKWGLWFVFTSRTLDRLYTSTKYKPIHSAALEKKAESPNPYLKMFMGDV
ncbi:hypothetical protein [Shewanella sp. AC91-MNA-CIBAN-0169]|uniref:hypothetical protein n=1 Tax=Shewanella sp. AC91-MNA-CIBAN-0169 TaxID=3140466 RepID=UPI0033302FAB